MRLARMSDDAIASTLGERLRERRLSMNITQEALAESIGISTPTLQKIEQGKGTIATLIATLRELDSLDLLNSLLNQPTVSPMAVRKLTNYKRVRAASSVLKNVNRPAQSLLIPMPNKNDIIRMTGKKES